MGPANALSSKDANATMSGNDSAKDSGAKSNIKSMEYHRQVLHSKMEEEKYGVVATFLPQKHPANPLASGRNKQQYISPSDNIMSPCTAKLNALKGRQANKAKPKSLFAQTSTKKFDGENVFGAKNASQSTSPEKRQNAN
ncbi:hypothetical protein F5B20DRAFT_395347 [Whalleya microplaca]|nr:hypothetical protein F5B20DRAFT_395347 [Whalleya microplaca]